MSQIALSKSTEKVNFFFTVATAVTVGTVVRKIMQPLHKKNQATSIFFFISFSQYFGREQFDTFEKRCDDQKQQVLP